MANSSWRTLSNEVYKLAGMQPVSSDEAFDNDALLEKPFLQGKYAIKLACKHLGVRAVRHFAERWMELPISADSAVYPLDVGINPSALSFRSFYNATAGSAAAGRLEVIDEDDFNQAYPDTSIITSGRPTSIILLTSERTEVSPLWQVRVFPNPDDFYTIRYKAKLKPYALTQASDLVLWPEEYEHVLIEFAWALLERGLGEGKEGKIDMLAMQAANDVALASGPAEDVLKAVRTMRPINNRRNRWPYNYNRVIW